MFHPKFLKYTKDNIIEPLKITFQKSIDESILPPIEKKRMLVLSLKKGEKEKPENYHSISYTSVPGKLMEKLVRDKIVKHVMEKTFLQMYNMASSRANFV